MKKFLLALAGIAVSLMATPALAQKMPSANDAYRYEEAMSPAYQAASHPRSYNTYNNYGAYGGYSSYGYPPAYAGQDATCVQAIIVSYCSTHPERTQTGQTCSDGAGRLFAYDANRGWYYVEGSTGAAMNVGQMASKCPFSSYEATATPPAPVVVAPAVPVPAAAPSSFTYRDGNCLYTVTTFADGTHKVTKQYSPQ